MDGTTNAVIRMSDYRGQPKGWSKAEVAAVGRVLEILSCRGHYVTAEYIQADDGTPMCVFDRMDQVAEMNNAVTKLGGRYVVTDGAGRVKSCASRMSLCLGQWLFGGTKDPEWFFNNTRHIGTAADGSTTSGGPQHGTVSS